MKDSLFFTLIQEIFLFISYVELASNLLLLKMIHKMQRIHDDQLEHNLLKILQLGVHLVVNQLFFLQDQLIHHICLNILLIIDVL
ncbi:Uncharacterised protein [Chlamydia trachomatis]|nr:Uncharacterised protein [Chlamydia trachomatis]CRH55724.1 Uncharacterised protein [Chlamydia trachomatis]CRH56860.1 Uncharacterised protein [Chlamydia trachomatis]